ncbi:MAG: hypothetical protein R3A78_13230 [Polyangiales bacterium]|nr:hypothetical protein [Myxococcales bacterium]
MLTIYLACLVAGGVLVVVSLLSGGDHDADGHDGLDHDASGHDLDADGEVHGDIEADMDAGHDAHGHHAIAVHGGGGIELADVFPVLSFRFWTFFLAFGGLTGVLLTWLGELPALGTVLASAGVGYVSGAVVTLAMKLIRRSSSGKATNTRDYVGATARVLLPVGKAAIGKVRIELDEAVYDVLAATEDDTTFAINDEVIVYEVRTDGSVVVTSKPR